MNDTAHDEGSGKAVQLQEAGVGHDAEHDWVDSQGVLKGPQRSVMKVETA